MNLSPSPNPIRILTVDDHPLFQSGIAALLATQPDMSLVAEASNGREAIEQCRVHRPDITLMDLRMREIDGLDALSAICGEFPEARIIILTTFVSDVQILRAMKLGARAYLVKNLLDRELLETIRAVHAGKKTLSAEVSYELAEHATDEALTPAEVAVPRLIAAGNANKQIAAQLNITEETVKGRVKLPNFFKSVAKCASQPDIKMLADLPAAVTKIPAESGGVRSGEMPAVDRAAVSRGGSRRSA